MAEGLTCVVHVEDPTCVIRVEESFAYEGDRYFGGKDYEVDMRAAKVAIGAGYALEARVHDFEHSPRLTDTEEIEKADIVPVVEGGGQHD